MEKKINLPDIGRSIILYKNSPAKLDEIQLTLAGWYSYYSEEMINLELKEATFWEEHKNFGTSEVKSDPLVRALWKVSEDGHRMIEIERTLKTIHILISSLKSSINRHNSQARNQQ